MYIHFELAYYSFLAFGIETTNTFLPPVAPSKPIADSKLKWANSLPVFRPKRRQNYTLWDGTKLYGRI